MGRAATTGCSSTRCSGWPAPEHAGATCRSASATIKPSSVATTAGSQRGALGSFLAVLTAEADLERLMIDSTIVRAHQHAAGARIAKGGLMPRDWAAPAAA